MAALVPTAAYAGGAGEKNGRYEAGASGIGDEYYPVAGNGGYDVEHYLLQGTYDPATDGYDGVATITGTATLELYRFNLDLVGMTVASIEVNDKPAAWTRDGQELVVTPQRKVKDGAPLEVVVHYAGVPTEFLLPGFGIRTGFMATDDGATVAGQPDVAAGWYPVNDHPLDKAAYTFEITVPDGLGVVANGFLEDQTSANGWTTFTWDAPEPMASYLATINIGEWDIRSWTTDSGIPVYDAVDPDLLSDTRRGPAIDASLARQGEVLDVLSEAFGPYPFSTVGAIVDDQPDLFFALETQTRPVYSKYFWPAGGDGVVVHELAHQWFGDDVALARWQDIWLNEGFATYAEWIWAEHEGFATTQEIFEAIHDEIPADDPLWDVVIGAPGVDLLFDNAVYVRGAMTLQALRNEVGDEAFWEIVTRWASEQSGGNGTTDEFIALAEDVAGTDLGALFDLWLFTAGKPALTPALTATAAPLQSPSATASDYSAQWLSDVAARLEHGRY
ncbi:MAG: M1 family metallopeptidase [Jiangellaceae bacterium]